MQKGVVVWFTGLPNAGKTTISKLVQERLEAMGCQVELLDSDEVPRSLTKDLSPDWVTRQRQKCTNLCFIAKLLHKHRFIVLIASVGRFREMRDMARRDIPDFIEVYLKCPQKTRLERDDKAKYRRYPETIHYYEEPEHPELTIETDRCPAEESAAKVIGYLAERGFIATGT